MSKVREISLHDVVKQMEGTVVSEMDGEIVMLSIEKGKYYNLGDIGGKIWGLMENPVAVHQMVSMLIAEYNVEQAECEAHVVSFLKDLHKEGLIHIGE